MSAFLDLLPGLRAHLWVHLLQNDVEQVAIVFAAVDTQGDEIVFRTKEVYVATPDDFEIHSGYHIELTDEARRASSRERGTPARPWSSSTATPATTATSGLRCSRPATCTASRITCPTAAGASAAGPTWRWS